MSNQGRWGRESLPLKHWEKGAGCKFKHTGKIKLNTARGFHQLF
jgi:hypothetical protein